MATLLLQWAGLRIIPRVNTREGLGKRAGGHWFKEWLKLAWTLQEKLNSNTTEEHSHLLQGESQDKSHPGRSCQNNWAVPSELQEATALGATSLGELQASTTGQRILRGGKGGATRIMGLVQPPGPEAQIATLTSNPSLLPPHSLSTIVRGWKPAVHRAWCSPVVYLPGIWTPEAKPSGSLASRLKGDKHTGCNDLTSGRTTASNSCTSLKCANVCYQISHFSWASLPSNGPLLQRHNSYQQLINKIVTQKFYFLIYQNCAKLFFSSFFLKLRKIIFKSVLTLTFFKLKTIKIKFSSPFSNYKIISTTTWVCAASKERYSEVIPELKLQMCYFQKNDFGGKRKQEGSGNFFQTAAGG